METFFEFADQIPKPPTEDDPLHSNFNDMVASIVIGKADPRLLPDNEEC